MINFNQGSKTPLLQKLRKAFHFSRASTKNSSPPVDELIELAKINPVNRRRFISDFAKAGIAAGAAGFIASCRKTNSAFVKTTTPMIAIVGAGVAGLNCCYQLKKAGIASTVYEASRRWGGRIFTGKNVIAQDISTELGGEFIDSGHRDMINLCAEFNLPLIDFKSGNENSLFGDSYFFNNRFFSIDEVIEAFEPYAARIQADIDSLPDVITFDNYGNAGKFDKLSISEYFDKIDLSGWLREALEVAYLTEYGREVHDQSSINFLYLFSPDTSKGSFDIFGISDERYKISGGNQQITDALYQHVKENVFLERFLVKIEENFSGSYNLYFNNNGSTQVVKADMVVMALPFSTLRNVEIKVEMPNWKLNAIKQLGYGTNAKLFMGFNERVWRKYNYTGYLFTDGAVQNGWDHSELQDGTFGGYTAFQGGKAGLALGKEDTNTQASKFIKQLDKVWNGCEAAYNGKAQRMFWPEYPFTLASYACYKPGQWTTIAGAEHRTVSKIFFAGEHCSFAFQGYMNGAAQTGRVAAENILRRLD
jgi:monoamine oxidase